MVLWAVWKLKRGAPRPNAHPNNQSPRNPFPVRRNKKKRKFVREGWTPNLDVNRQKKAELKLLDQSVGFYFSLNQEFSMHNLKVLLTNPLLFLIAILNIALFWINLIYFNLVSSISSTLTSWIMWIKLLGLFLVIVVIIGSIAETKQRTVKRTLHWKYLIDYTLHVRGYTLHVRWLEKN